MSYADERKRIEKQWKDKWRNGSGQKMTETSYEGVPFAVPSQESWARITIRNGDVAQISAGAPGANLHRHPGVIIVNLFVPAVQEGKNAHAVLREMIDQALGVFRNITLGNVRIWEGSGSVVGVDGPWLSGTVKWEFWRDESL